jgi:hypothetical protein
VDGPAGFGKTTFLLELQKYYQASGWVCAYSKLPKKIRIDTRYIASLIIRQLDPAKKIEPDATIPALGAQIAACLLSHPINEKTTPILLKQAEHMGAALFIDNAEVLDDATVLSLSELIVGINKSLMVTGFYHKNNMFRFFLSGRDLRRKRNNVLRKILPYSGLSLSPFTFQYVEETVKKYVQKAESTLPDETSARIAAKLMYLCGGHPGLIAEILTELTESSFASASAWLEKQPDDEFTERSAAFGAVVENYAGDIPGLAPVINTLSVFRRFGPWLLRDLIQDGHISAWQDEHQLANELTNSYLLHREKEGYLEDSITQRLLNIQLRFSDNKTFQELCRRGMGFYRGRLSHPKTLHPVQWAVEYLYLCLQYAYYAEDKRGAELKVYFLDIIRECTTLLNKNWDDQGLCSDLFVALREDWELEFFTNYFLMQNDLYTDEHSKLLDVVEKNCRACNSGTCTNCAQVP